jgi:hypothetical protein
MVQPVRNFAALAFLTLIASPAIGDLPSTVGWHQLANTRLRSVCAAENGFPGVAGAWGCEAITGAWSGGVFDTKRNRLIVWGGGHNDYYGNELYALELDAQTVRRLNAPGLPVASSCTEGIVNNTQPNSRHTYDGIEYVAALDRMFVFGGSLACGSGNFGSDTWVFDFDSMQWSRMNPAGPIPRGDAGMMTAYDPVTGLIYLHDRRHLFTYDPAANRYTQLSTSQETLGYHLAATIDPKRRKFVMVGYDGNAGGGRVYTYDIAPGSTYVMQRITTTGATGLIGQNYPGLDFDPVGDRIVGWGQDTRNVVYFLDLTSRAWTSTTISGGPVPVGNGTHGRFRYSAKSGVFALVNRVDDNAFVLRLSNDTAAPPATPSNLTVQ